MLVLKLARQPGSPANPTVRAGHICYWRSGRCRFEPRSLSDHISDLVTAPTVSLYADRFLIHIALIDHRLDRRQHALKRALSGMPDRVDDVGFEHEITVARVEGRVDAVTGPRVNEAIQVFGQGLVDVNDHRILLRRIEVFGLDQHSR